MTHSRLLSSDEENPSPPQCPWSRVAATARSPPSTRRSPTTSPALAARTSSARSPTTYSSSSCSASTPRKLLGPASSPAAGATSGPSSPSSACASSTNPGASVTPSTPVRCLRYLLIGAPNVTPQSLAAWLLVAARRVFGELLLTNLFPERSVEDSDDEEEATERGAFELPCFEKATSISLDLGFLGISVPPNGVFARLTELSLSNVRFHGPGDLGDAVSSPRCPCLQKLTVCNTRGLDRINIDSESLQVLELKNPRGLRQLTVEAPALKDLSVTQCFLNDQNQPIVNISAPQLELLSWVDRYDPSSVHLGNMEHLQTLGTFFFVYGPHGFTHNRACLMLLPRFKAIENLTLSLVYILEADNLQYMMEDMTVLPDVKCLHLFVMALGHAFGAGPFHVLRIFSGIQQLILVLSPRFELKEETACSSDCICDQPIVWKNEELSLNHLQELEIQEFRASEHEVAFVKRLLNWATVLKMMTVTFHYSITDSKAKELFQMFRSLSKPAVCMKFYIYREFRMDFVCTRRLKLPGCHFKHWT